MESNRPLQSPNLQEDRTFKTLLPQIAAALISSSSCFIAGTSVSYSAILIPQLEDKRSDILVTKSQASWIASVFVLVSAIASPLSGYFMHRWGRTSALKLSIIPGMIGWAVIALASNVPMLIVGRILTAITNTVCTNASIVYITEISRKDVRGSMVSLVTLFINFGVLVTYIKGWLLSWRTVAWLAQIYHILTLTSLFLISESPAWLLSKLRQTEARRAVFWFHKHQTKSYKESLFDQLLLEEDQKRFETRKDGGGLAKDFLKPTGYKPLLIICGLFLFQQFSGITILLYYSVTFMQAVGTSVNPYVASIFLGLIRLFMSIVSVVLMKRFTRRILMMISAFGMAVTIFTSGLLTHLVKKSIIQANWTPILFLIFYAILSMVGVLPIPLSITAELFPLNIRSLAHSVSACFAFVVTFLAVQSYVTLENLFGGSAGIQWFFAAVSAGNLIFSFVFLPETHRKKLSEIEEYFMENTVYPGHKKTIEGAQVSFEKSKDVCSVETPPEKEELLT